MIDHHNDERDECVRMIERKLSFANEAFLTGRHYEAALSLQLIKTLLRRDTKRIDRDEV